MTEQPTVACVLLRKGDDVLGSARKNDPNDYGLPGGKLEAFDVDPKAGAIRELLQETGVRVLAEDLVEVLCAYDEGGCLTVTYEALKWEGEPTQQAGEGRCDWVPWEALEQGSFGGYNKTLHDRVRGT